MSDTWSPIQTGGSAPERATGSEPQRSSVVERTTPRVPESFEAAKNKTADFVEGQKTAGAARINEVAQAVHRAAEELEQSIPQAAAYVHRAADTIEQTSESLKHLDFRDLMNSFQKLSRSQPAILFGSSVLAGFALSRFLKSSATQSTLADTSGESR